MLSLQGSSFKYVKEQTHLSASLVDCCPPTPIEPERIRCREALAGARRISGFDWGDLLCTSEGLNAIDFTPQENNGQRIPGLQGFALVSLPAQVTLEEILNLCIYYHFKELGYKHSGSTEFTWTIWENISEGNVRVFIILIILADQVLTSWGQRHFFLFFTFYLSFFCCVVVLFGILFYLCLNFNWSICYMQLYYHDISGLKCSQRTEKK